MIEGFENLATAIYPYLEYQFSVGRSEVNTKGEMSSIANTKTISDSITKTQSINIGLNTSQANTHGESTTNSTTNTESVSETNSDTVGGSFGASYIVQASASYSQTCAKTVMKSIAQTIASTVSNAVSNTIGRSVGYGYSFGKTHTVANSNTKTTGKNSSISIGTDSHTTYSYKSYMVNDILDKLEKTIKKINVASATGVWKYSTYVFASDSTKSKNIANFLRATTQGNESYIDPCVIQEWSKSDEDNTFEEIKRYLSHAKHPIFFVNNYELFTIDSSLTPLE